MLVWWWFFDQSGAQLSAATQNLVIAAHASQTFDQTAPDSNLPVGFYGWAKIEGAGGSQLVAQVLEQNKGAHFVALVSAPAEDVEQSTTNLYAPAIYRDAFEGSFTGANIVNTNGEPVQVTVTYYRQDGVGFPSTPFELAAHAVQPIYQGASGDSAKGLPVGGLPAGFVGAASISSTAGGGGGGSSGVVMVVNEAGRQTEAGTARSGTYLASNAGSSSLGLPIVAKNSNGYTSGVSVLNISNQNVTGYIQYYAPNGMAAGAKQGFEMAAHSSYLIYQGAVNNLPTSFVGQANIVQTSGPSNSLLATTNVQ